MFWLFSSLPSLIKRIEVNKATLGSDYNEDNFPQLSLNLGEATLSQQRDRHLSAIEIANYLQA